MDVRDECFLACNWSVHINPGFTLVEIWAWTPYLWAVSQLPKVMEQLEGFVYVWFYTMVKHVFYQQRMGFITHFENVFWFHKTKAFMSWLQIVEGLSHVSLSSENDSFKTVIAVFDGLSLANFKNFGQNLNIISKNWPLTTQHCNLNASKFLEGRLILGLDTHPSVVDKIVAFLWTVL